MDKTWRVEPITKKQAEAFVVAKHYSHRASIFWAAFGLVVNEKIEGVVVFGQPSPSLQKYAFRERDFRMYELSRLVVQTPAKNAASFLVGSALRMLPAPCAVVSYADIGWGHAGIVYQATNWVYTGVTKNKGDSAYIVDGKPIHQMSLLQLGVTNKAKWAAENNVQRVPASKKHRYFFACGTPRQKRKMLGALTYPQIPEYPKLTKSTYDAGPAVDVYAADTKVSWSHLV